MFLSLSKNLQGGVDKAPIDPKTRTFVFLIIWSFFCKAKFLDRLKKIMYTLHKASVDPKTFDVFDFLSLPVFCDYGLLFFDSFLSLPVFLQGRVDQKWQIP